MDELRSQPRPDVAEDPRYYVEIEYEHNQEPIVVNDKVIATAHRRWFRFRADREFLRSCLAVGGAVAAIGATVYFLKHRFSLEATPFASGSVIYGVIVPKKSATKFEKLMENGEIQDGLSAVFKDIVKYLTDSLGEKFIKDIGSERIEQLKNIRVTAVKLCDEKSVQKALESDEEPSQSIKNAADSKTTGLPQAGGHAHSSHIHDSMVVGKNVAATGGSIQDSSTGGQFTFNISGGHKSPAGGSQEPAEKRKK